MKCPFCSYTESRVIDSRAAEDSGSIRRRRECLNCNRRFTTYEKVEMVPLFVVKKDSRREAFDVQKIRAGILRACEKRPVSITAIDDAVARIEREVYSLSVDEVPSREIGEIVMRALKELDQVAYVRFASVYRQFADVSSFMEELNKLVTESK